MTTIQEAINKRLKKLKQQQKDGSVNKIEIKASLQQAGILDKNGNIIQHITA